METEEVIREKIKRLSDYKDMQEDILQNNLHDKRYLYCRENINNIISLEAQIRTLKLILGEDNNEQV